MAGQFQRLPLTCFHPRRQRLEFVGDAFLFRVRRVRGWRNYGLSRPPTLAVSAAKNSFGLVTGFSCSCVT